MTYHTLVENQRAHFRSGATRSLAARRALLEKYRDVLTKHQNELSGAISKDLRRDGTFEVLSCIDAIQKTLEKLDEWSAPKKLEISAPLIDSDDLYLVREPLGVCLTILPWNGPMFCGIPVIQALASGNCAIIKPSELADNFATAFEKVVNQNFPAEVFAVVTGGIPETTELLKERFDHIFYTGCPPVAKIVMTAAAKYLTPVVLELGGKNPCVIADDADFTHAADKIVEAKIMNFGQACINPDYILTTEKSKPKVIAALGEAWEKKEFRKNPMFAKIINERHFDRLLNLLKNTKGSVVYKLSGEANREEGYIPPHVVEVQKGDELLKDEIFGPITPILAIKDLDEALDYIKHNEKPLAAYIYTKSKENAARFIRETSSGGVTVNDCHAHAFSAGVPFGGVGNSGMGSINGKYSYDCFTHEKTCLLRENVGKQLNGELQ